MPSATIQGNLQQDLPSGVLLILCRIMDVVVITGYPTVHIYKSDSLLTARNFLKD